MNGMYVDDLDGLSGIDWGGLIGQGFDFGKNFINQKYAKDAAKHTAAAQAAIQYQPAVQTFNSNPGSSAPPPPGVGFGIDSQGVRLSDGSHIGWPVIGIVGLGFFLLQSRGFQKRGR
jgi:hypothetical protein